MIPKHEILEAAKEAGMAVSNWGNGYWDSKADIERFAAIIERKTIERGAVHFEAQPHMERFGDDIAAAIRKLGDE